MGELYLGEEQMKKAREIGMREENNQKILQMYRQRISKINQEI
jgi:hypothetical protein